MNEIDKSPLHFHDSILHSLQLCFEDRTLILELQVPVDKHNTQYTKQKVIVKEYTYFAYEAPDTKYPHDEPGDILIDIYPCQNKDIINSCTSGTVYEAYSCDTNSFFYFAGKEIVVIEL